MNGISTSCLIKLLSFEHIVSCATELRATYLIMISSLKGRRKPHSGA
jgi:hypothetical protein